MLTRPTDAHGRGADLPVGGRPFACVDTSDRHWRTRHRRRTIPTEVKKMMYPSAEALVWWAFVGGLSFILVLAAAFALVYRWAAPQAK
jgi:hypothetical protein